MKPTEFGRYDAVIGYDAVIVGGGVSAVICAHTMATAGLKVMVACNQSSLMHEIGLSRLQVGDMEEIARQFEAVQSWFTLIKQYNGYHEGRFDPVLVQLLCDRYLKERQVDVLFEAKPLKLSIDHEDRLEGIQVVTRAGVQLIPCRTVIDCSENALIIGQLCEKNNSEIQESNQFWTLTTVNHDPLACIEAGSFTMQDQRYDVRTEAALHTSPALRTETPLHTENPLRTDTPHGEDRLHIRVAVTSPLTNIESEIGFMSKLEEIFRQIQNQTEKHIGDLVHVSEKPWSPALFRIANSFPSGVSAHSGAVFGTGCWLESIESKVRKAALWEKDSIAMKESMIAGAELAQHVLNNTTRKM